MNPAMPRSRASPRKNGHLASGGAFRSLIGAWCRAIRPEHQARVCRRTTAAQAPPRIKFHVSRFTHHASRFTPHAFLLDYPRPTAQKMRRADVRHLQSCLLYTSDAADEEDS